MMAHQDAVITNAAVSSAIASAFGKDRGGFRRFLSQFKEQSDTDPMLATAGLRNLSHQTLDDTWKEF